jgi:lipopolysaccharide export system permease protein
MPRIAMNKLSLYVLRQTLGPLFFFSLLLTAIIWLTQSLEMLDLVLNRGQSALTFLQLTLFVLPSLLTLILPVALFAAALYGLNRLKADSELVVMWSAGIGRWAIAWPVLAVAASMTLAGFALNTWLMPVGYRAMKARVYEIKDDLAASFLREGAFVTPAKGLTVYISGAPPGGDLLGIMVHDNRKASAPVTYMAERGLLVRTDEGPRLVMQNGVIQRMKNRDGNLQTISFEKHTFDLSEYAGERAGALSRDLTERYLGELFRPDLTKKWDRRNRGRLIAEGHSRLATPFYNLAFAAIALVTVLCGVYRRHGDGRRMLIAVGCVIALRALGFTVQSLAANTPALNAAQYVLPLGAFVFCLWLLTPWADLRRFRRPGAAAETGAEAPA